MNYYDLFHRPYYVAESEYAAGDKFILEVQYDWTYGWSNYPGNDYTLKIYSKQNLEIKDENGETNMWNMDGQFPSRFTKSHFRTETTRWMPEFKPKSLQDIWLVSNNIN